MDSPSKDDTDNIVFLFLSPKKQRSVQIVKETYVSYEDGRVMAAWPNFKDLAQCHRAIKKHPENPPDDWPMFRGKVIKDGLSWNKAVKKCKKANSELVKKMELVESASDVDGLCSTSTDSEAMGSRGARKRKGREPFPPPAATKTQKLTKTTSLPKPPVNISKNKKAPGPIICPIPLPPAMVSMSPKRRDDMLPGKSVEAQQDDELNANYDEEPYQGDGGSVNTTINVGELIKKHRQPLIDLLDDQAAEKSEEQGSKRDRDDKINRKLDYIIKMLEEGQSHFLPIKAKVSAKKVDRSPLPPCALPLNQDDEVNDFVKKLLTEDFYNSMLNYLLFANDNLGIHGLGDDKRLSCLVKSNMMSMLFTKDFVASCQKLAPAQKVQNAAPKLVQLIFDVAKRSKMVPCDLKSVKALIDDFMRRKGYDWRKEGFGPGLAKKDVSKPKSKENPVKDLSDAEESVDVDTCSDDDSPLQPLLTRLKSKGLTINKSPRKEKLSQLKFPAEPKNLSSRKIENGKKSDLSVGLSSPKKGRKDSLPRSLKKNDAAINQDSSILKSPLKPARKVMSSKSLMAIQSSAEESEEDDGSLVNLQDLT